MMRLYEVIITALIIMLSPPLAQATPREIILYPSAALITESRKLPFTLSGNERTTEFTLPAAAIPHSLKVALAQDAGFKIDNITVRRQTIVHDRLMQELKRRSAALDEENIRIRSGLAALDTQILFWQTQAKGRAKNAHEAANFSQVISRNLKRLHQEKISLERDYKINVSRIFETQSQFVHGVAEKAPLWQVTVHIGGLPPKELTLTWTYLARDCGWRPYYRVNAVLPQQRIEVISGVEIWQNTDQNWNQVLLTLAHGDPTVSYTDCPMNFIAPQKKATAGKTPLATSDENYFGLLEGRPEILKNSTMQWLDGRITSLGGRTILSRKRVKLPLVEESWPAFFIHRLSSRRPAEAILIGMTRPTGFRSYSSGVTDLLVEGTWWRRSNLSLTGYPLEIVFGADPLVIISNSFVVRRDETDADDKQTATGGHWYRITNVVNRRQVMITLVLNENLPQSIEGEDVTGKALPNPPPDNQSLSKAIWSKDIPPSQEIIFTRRLIINLPSAAIEQPQ